jgi:cell division protein FtsW
MGVTAIAAGAASVPARAQLLRVWLSRLLAIFAILLVWGSAAVYSTTVYQRIALSRPPYTDFIKHLFFAAIGLGAGFLLVFAATRMRPLKRWARYLIPIAYCISLAMIIMVKFSQYGERHYGADLTLNLGFVSFQPSELMKLTTVMYLAMLLCWWRDPAGMGDGEQRQQATGVWAWVRKLFLLRSTRPAWPELPRRAALVLLLPIAVCVIERDMGAAGMILMMGVITIALAGVDWKQLAACAALVIVLGTAGAMLKPDFVAYARDRLDTYFALLQNRPVDQNGDAYQITQSRGTLALGGLTGRGYLHSEQKMNRLPVCTEDFVFPIMVEEFGYVGGVGIILLFIGIAWCGVNLANACHDPFNRTVIAALGLGLCLQAFVNIGTTIGTLPVTGLTLPFFSEGGTSIVVSILALSIMTALALNEMVPDKRERLRAARA